MTALHPIKTPAQQHRPKRRHPYHQWVTAEITVKLIVNGILSIIAVTTIIKLLPYQWSQQQKLKELGVEVQETQKRVNKLRAEFNRNFDPSQTKKVMQEQSPRLAPNERPIFWSSN